MRATDGGRSGTRERNPLKVTKELDAAETGEDDTDYNVDIAYGVIQTCLSRQLFLLYSTYLLEIRNILSGCAQISTQSVKIFR